MRLEKNMKKRYIISLLEGVIFILLILFIVLAIFDLLSTELSTPYDLFSLWSIRIAFFLFILFVLFPYILVISSRVGENVSAKYNQQKFKRSFSAIIKETEEINIVHLSNKFDVNLVYIKNFLRDQITQGFIKGELTGDIFKFKKMVKATNKKEKTVELFKKDIIKYVQLHSLIELKEISKHFKVPKNLVKTYLIKLMEEGKITGFFQGNTLIRSAFSMDEIECPHCKKKIDLNEI